MAGESLKNNFKKGTTTLAILTLLREKRMYGYELVQTMDRLSDGKFVMRETALYPVLYRLEDQGMILGEKVPEGKRRLKVYYQITPKGLAYLNTIRAEYQQISSGIQMILDSADKEARHE